MLVAIEGIPAAGKTTTAELLGSQLSANVVEETTADHPFLDQVYNDGYRDDATIELGFLIVHANPFRLLDRRQLTVADYSPAKDLLFAEDMLGEDDLRLFRAVFDHLYYGHELPELVVYLDVPAELCLERAQARRRNQPGGRDFEAGLDLDRLVRMKDRYESSLDSLGQEILRFQVGGEENEDAVASGVARLVAPHLRQPATG